VPGTGTPATLRAVNVGITATDALTPGVCDLPEANIRRLNGPNGDPRLQTLDIVA
jgi:hypothetical protein